MLAVQNQEMKMPTMFNMNAPKHTEAYLRTRAELMSFMADYTYTGTAPKSRTGGWYAVVTLDTGKVWLAETKNFSTTLARFRSSNQLPKELKALVKEGEKVGIWLTTKDIDVDRLRFALEEIDSLLSRGSRTNQGEGKLYVITHTSGHYYLTKARGKELKDSDILTRFIGRILEIRQTHHYQTNQLLQAFISDNAGDLLRETGFNVRLVSKFKSSEEAVELMNQYYIDQSKLVCLNHVFDKR